MAKTIALAWFAREDYSEMKKICDDELHETFEEWEAVITQRMARFDGIGVVLERIILRPAELKAWAEENGLPINSATRAAYAAMIFGLKTEGRLN